jgi:polyribonucleotide nucleotidyltransferase
VEVLPGKEGLLHVSEISTNHIPRIEDAFNIGDEVLVIVKEIDDMNRINLSRRRALEQSAAVQSDPELAAMLPVEAARDERYATLPKGEGPRPRDSRPGGDRPRGGGHHRPGGTDRPDRPDRSDRRFR